MTSDFASLATLIHAAPGRVVLAITGGGSRAISELLEVPGASRTVLEAVVPYSSGAMIEWIRGRPDQFCSPATARAMAMAAFRRAMTYRESDELVAGIACTASLASDRPKRGGHRVHLALQTAARTAIRSLQLVKGGRSRLEEEDVVTRLVLNLVAEACGIAGRLELPLQGGEAVEAAQVEAPAAWRGLLLGNLELLRHGGPAGMGHRQGRLVFPGAFNPLHHGHRRMAEVAARKLGRPVDYELSLVNVDKPPLDYLEIDRRLAQFSRQEAVWLTRAATFEEKSRLFPGATFVVGTDTLRRIAVVQYYRDERALDETLAHLAERDCRFLVFGRIGETGFVELDDLNLPETLLALCTGISAAEFREDISSTELRQDVGEAEE